MPILWMDEIRLHHPWFQPIYYLTGVGTCVGESNHSRVLAWCEMDFVSSVAMGATCCPVSLDNSVAPGHRGCFLRQFVNIACESPKLEYL